MFNRRRPPVRKNNTMPDVQVSVSARLKPAPHVAIILDVGEVGEFTICLTSLEMVDQMVQAIYEGTKQLWGNSAVDEAPAPDAPSLGTCCFCGQSSPTVRNVLTLPMRGMAPGKGWGCLQCGLPLDGAVAVLCDDCLTAHKLPIWACIGNPADNLRIPIAELDQTHFGHDLSKHPEQALTPHIIGQAPDRPM